MLIDEHPAVWTYIKTTTIYYLDMRRNVCIDHKRKQLRYPQWACGKDKWRGIKTGRQIGRQMNGRLAQINHRERAEVSQELWDLFSTMWGETDDMFPLWGVECVCVVMMAEKCLKRRVCGHGALWRDRRWKRATNRALTPLLQAQAPR